MKVLAVNVFNVNIKAFKVVILLLFLSSFFNVRAANYYWKSLALDNLFTNMGNCEMSQINDMRALTSLCSSDDNLLNDCRNIMPVFNCLSHNISDNCINRVGLTLINLLITRTNSRQCFLDLFCLDTLITSRFIPPYEDGRLILSQQYYLSEHISSSSI